MDEYDLTENNLQAGLETARARIDELERQLAKARRMSDAYWLLRAAHNYLAGILADFWNADPFEPDSLDNGVWVNLAGDTYASAVRKADSIVFDVSNPDNGGEDAE